MAHDDDGDDTARAAILARRQRFIALALSGLASACGDGKTSPQPCLDVAPQTESSSVTGPTEGDTTASTGDQQPCLGAVPDTSSSDTSGASASSSSSGTDTGATTGTEGSTTGDDSATEGSSGGEDLETSGGPLPCLSPPR